MDRVITRRRLIQVSAAGVGALALSPTLLRTALAAPPGLEKKDKYKVGFSQVEMNNPWRTAQTASMQDEAKKRGDELVYTDAGGSEAKQIADVDSMIAQQVDLIFLAPRSEKPLAQAVLKAKAAGIPVILLDRNVDQTIAKPGEDFVCFIGSNFIQEGARAAEWLTNTMGGTATIIELEGTTGSSPAMDRKKGFHDYIGGTYNAEENSGTPAAPVSGGFPDMKVVASQTGDFARDKGRQVFETLYQANPTANAVYAHNDEMALGAIAAIEAAGKVPGKDLIIVSVDGSRDALQAIIDGKLGATVECNPRFGPKAFETLDAYAGGEQIPIKIINPDKFFDSSNAPDEIANAY
ncbi:MAG TPA: ABC transporter substrate-binding protein [Thermomicrobiales bacterium]|jgi:galactofuranose transport system substrate-binding protein|nr:ABC transporter substrate-binding protein [Thermomicrobiales bacterium]